MLCAVVDYFAIPGATVGMLIPQENYWNKEFNYFNVVNIFGKLEFWFPWKQWWLKIKLNFLSPSFQSKNKIKYTEKISLSSDWVVAGLICPHPNPHLSQFKTSFLELSRNTFFPVIYFPTYLFPLLKYQCPKMKAELGKSGQIWAENFSHNYTF